MLNMIKMDLYRMVRTKSMYVVWIVMAAAIFFLSSRLFLRPALCARLLIPRIPLSMNLLISAPISMTYIHM